MKTSESIIKIAPALLKAQKATNVAVKGAKNPFYKSTYADLESVIGATKKHLNDNGITALQPVGYVDTTNGIKTTIETILIHESGEFISDTMIVTMDKDGPQAQGSAISYAKRYSLQSLMLLPSADDDGEGATDRKKKVAVETMTKLQQKELMGLVDELPDAESLKLHTWMKKGGITKANATKSLNHYRDIIALKKGAVKVADDLVETSKKIDDKEQEVKLPF